MQCLKKNIQVCTSFEPMTSAIQVQCRLYSDGSVS